MKSYLQKERQSKKAKNAFERGERPFKARKMTKSEIRKWVTFYESSERRTPSAFILFKNISRLNPKSAKKEYKKLSGDIKSDYERCAEIIKISAHNPEAAFKIIDSQIHFHNYNSNFFELTLTNAEKPSRRPSSTKKTPHVELTQGTREPCPGHVNNDISFVDQNIFNNHDIVSVNFTNDINDMPPVAPNTNIFFPSNDGNITGGKRSSSQLLNFFDEDGKITEGKRSPSQLPDSVDEQDVIGSEIFFMSQNSGIYSFEESDNIINILTAQSLGIPSFDAIACEQQPQAFTSEIYHVATGELQLQTSIPEIFVTNDEQQTQTSTLEVYYHVPITQQQALHSTAPQKPDVQIMMANLVT
ncbi:5443_t:CDS:2 [Dentiscutata heterogama]|uniref:5443_t:CDS:1 n=1 Tax=Dentiscutata heterogama TaxID=1316150 RepID=A0ACA9KAE6_9GLOM|nr:5443_t:CDS:2 [Dentiscutata heterogama]